jgi:hypothetical protein
MCANAPEHHAVTYDDLIRIGHGVYMLKSSTYLDNMQIPSFTEVEKRYMAFQQREKRDAMYKTATFLVKHFWGKPSEMADSLGVLLLTWNQAVYRYGLFDFDKLEKCITSNQDLLDRYRERNILNYLPSDEQSVKHLFQQFLVALEICEGNKAGTKSPVAVSKALHLLSPAFFPLWDGQIAHAYDCYYSYNPQEKYMQFFRQMKNIAENLQHNISPPIGKTLLKLIDEYNYARYTKRWV